MKRTLLVCIGLILPSFVAAAVECPAELTRAPDSCGVAAKIPASPYYPARLGYSHPSDDGWKVSPDPVLAACAIWRGTLGVRCTLVSATPQPGYPLLPPNVEVQIGIPLSVCGGSRLPSGDCDLGRLMMNGRAFCADAGTGGWQAPTTLNGVSGYYCHDTEGWCPTGWALSANAYTTAQGQACYTHPLTPAGYGCIGGVAMPRDGLCCLR